jgi:hypothetical protein
MFHVVAPRLRQSIDERCNHSGIGWRLGHFIRDCCPTAPGERCSRGVVSGNEDTPKAIVREGVLGGKVRSGQRLVSIENSRDADD